MKKLLFVGVLALSTFSFAKTNNVVKSQIKFEKTTQFEKSTIKMDDPWWSVSYTNACGTTNTVYFQSANPDGSAAFNRELAYAVNSTYGIC